jgi:DNA-binding LytR/AlgR family response regulator
MLRIGICDDIREEVEKQEKQVRQITYQMGIRADIRKCYSGMDLLMEKLISDVYEKLQIDDKFAFKSNKTYYNISLNKIMYFMSEKRITNVYFIDKICTFYGKMNDVEINLRKKQVDFWRIHHSFWLIRGI